MEFSAVYHEMNKRYCYAIEKGRFLFRIRTKKDDIEKVVLHYQDKYIDIKYLDTRKTCEMTKVIWDRWFDYYEAEIQMDVICLRYYFELIDTKGDVSYYSNYEFYKEETEIPDIDRMFDCPQTLREEEMFLVPAWAKNKVVYQIFPSRFASSRTVQEAAWYQTPIDAKENLHGDLKGIINHLDHFKDLGVDVLYMTPIFASESIHKYDTIDYYKIDSDFGTEADLKELVEKAHAMGMRVILDGVFNHSSTKFFAFEDILKKQKESKYKNWYYLDGFPLEWERGKKPNYKSFAYYGKMPKLNLQNEETAEYFIEVGRYWIEKCQIDGWRLDVADEISHKFWRKFRSAMKAVNPEVLIVGEVWHQAEDFLDGEEWDSVMNYSFYFSVVDFIAKEKITASRFWENIGYLRGNLHTKAFPILWNLIDSHDTARFLHECKERKEKLKLAAALQLFLPGMPVIYYGDEYGLTGGNDPDCRRGMLWEEKYQDRNLYQWYRTLIQIRKKYPCITEGRIVKTETEDNEGLLILTKNLGEETIVLCFHAKEGEVHRKEYEGMINLLTGNPCSGIIKAYEVLVIQKTD